MEGIFELNRKGRDERKGDFYTTELTEYREGILEPNRKGREERKGRNNISIRENPCEIREIRGTIPKPSPRKSPKGMPSARLICVYLRAKKLFANDYLILYSRISFAM